MATNKNLTQRHGVTECVLIFPSARLCGDFPSRLLSLSPKKNFVPLFLCVYIKTLYLRASVFNNSPSSEGNDLAVGELVAIDGQTDERALLVPSLLSGSPGVDVQQSEGLVVFHFQDMRVS